MILDACVLAGSVRRHAVACFAAVGCFRPLWSDKICSEVRHAIPKTLGNSDIPTQLRMVHAEAVCEALKAAFPHAMKPVPLNLDQIISLPDPDDRHVLALAISECANVIVTENLRDFPKSALSPYNITALSTDQFLGGIAHHQPQKAKQAIGLLTDAIDRDGVGTPNVLAAFRKVGLKKLARILVE